MSEKSNHPQVLGIAGILPLDYSILLEKGESGEDVERELQAIPLPLPPRPPFNFPSEVIRKAGGGKVANILAYLGTAGHKVEICGAVGNDSVGATVLGELERYNINCDCVEVREGRHTRAIFIVYKDGWTEPRQYHRKAAPVAKYSPALLRKIPPSDFLVVGRANSSVNRLVRERKKSGLSKICFHVPSIPWRHHERKACDELLGLADLIVTRREDFEEAVQKAGLTQRNAAMASGKLVVGYGGANDLVAATCEGKLDSPLPSTVSILDPTGMMDVFHGALISFFLTEEWSMRHPFLKAALGYGNAIAVEKAHGVGARSFPPYPRQLELLEDQMVRYRRLSGPYHSAFLSYSHKDQEFVDKLYVDLRKWDVPCWSAPESLKTGEEFRMMIEAAIRKQERLLLVLSESSAQSDWVQWEVSVAAQIEDQQDRLVLFPLSIADLTAGTPSQWFTNLHKNRQICNFKNWKEPKEYEKSLGRLLRDLKKVGSVV